MPPIRMHQTSMLPALVIALLAMTQGISTPISAGTKTIYPINFRSGVDSTVVKGTVSLSTTPGQDPPLSPSPAEDTDRYVAWMEKQGKSIKDKPHENVSLRIGHWGFFYHGERPVGSWTPHMDRVALDRSGHVVTEAENSDWYSFLSTSRLDAASALKRVAWLFNAGGIDPTAEPTRNKVKITVPKLIAKDGSIMFQGWWEANSDPPYTRRITITATPTRTKLVVDR